MNDATTIFQATPQTAPAGITCPASSLLIAAAVVFLSEKRGTTSDKQFASVSVPTEPESAACWGHSQRANGEVREGTNEQSTVISLAAVADSRGGRNLFGSGNRLCGIARPVVINACACNAPAHKLATAGARCYQPQFAGGGVESRHAEKGRPRHGLHGLTRDRDTRESVLAADMRSKLPSRSSDRPACNPFPVECDLTTPRIRLTNPVTSPAASRRVVADGETINQRN
jgi:hypothetical protein